MKSILRIRFAVAMLAASILCTVASCASLKSALLGSPEQQAAVHTNSPGATLTPAISTTLAQVSPIVEAVAPQPWGTLIATGLNLLSTALAAFATFHARNAAASSATAAASKTG